MWDILRSNPDEEDIHCRGREGCGVDRDHLGISHIQKFLTLPHDKENSNNGHLTNNASRIG